METTWLWALLGLLTVPLFVAMNGLFVAAEFSLVAVRKTRVEEMVNQGQRGAKALSRNMHSASFRCGIDCQCSEVHVADVAVLGLLVHGQAGLLLQNEGPDFIHFNVVEVKSPGTSGP